MMTMMDESRRMTMDDRIFRAVSDTELTELSYIGFDNEEQMQELVQHNLERLFGLEFLASEFRDLDDGVHRLDTVAFDRKENTFVVIEYKNTLDRGVLDQAKTYLNRMKDKKADLTLEYIKKMGHHRNKTEFNWKAAYAIIVAPEFSERQIGSAKYDTDLELYRIKRYDKGDIVMRRAGGEHKRMLASTSTNAGNGRPESDPDIAEKDYLDEKGASDATRIIWYELKKRVQNELDIRFGMPWYGGAFYLPNRRLVCWIEVKSDRVELLCDIKKDQEIQTDDFFKYHKTWKNGTKNYRACIDTVAYIENAIRIVHTIYDLKSK